MIFVGKASYAILSQKKVSETIPVVEVMQNGNKLLLSVRHDKLIDKIIYTWNNEKKETVLQGKGRKQLEEIIELPVGINSLQLQVIDIDGKVTKFANQYELEEGDVIEPEIELLVDGQKVKIVAKDETEISYIEYFWNNEEATKLQATETSKKQIEERIELKKGENVLHIVAVDKAGNTSTTEQVYKGATRPSIDMKKEDDNMIITIKDEEGIKKVEIVLNGQYYSSDPDNTKGPINLKELELKQKLQQGHNTITVKVSNINDLERETTKEIDL